MISPKAFSRLMLTGITLPLIALLGCQQNSPLAGDPESILNATPPPATPSAIATSFGEGEHIPALFQIDLDLDALTGRATPIAARRGVSDQAQLYDLDLSTFMKPGSLRVTGVANIDGDTVEVTFTHAHPFAAPDWDLPATYLNRADLSYTGRLLILADVPTDQVAVQTFFGDTVANTMVVEQADGYVKPGDLLLNGGFTANCFPYVLLADEAENNRIGITNFGLPRGNYNTALGGWQQNNIGSESTGWTGFDFIHAGQVIENTVRFNRTAWNDGAPSFTAALLIKYSDPKGIGGKEIRLPPEDFDIFDFCYRVPHGCIDVSKIEAPSIVDVGGNLNAWTKFDVELRDWDAEAVVSPEPDLSIAIGPMWIPEGHEGKPTNRGAQPFAGSGLFIVPPPVNGSSGGTGEPGFEYLFQLTATNTGGWDDGVIRPIMFRFEDASLNQTTGPSRFGLDPVTLAPDAARALSPVTYQAVNVRYGEAPPVEPPPTMTRLVRDVGGSQAADVAASVFSLSGDEWIGMTYQKVESSALRFQRVFTGDVLNGAQYLESDIDLSPGVLGRLWMVSSTTRHFVASIDHSAGVLRLYGSATLTPTGPADWTRVDVVTGIVPADSIEGCVLKSSQLSILYSRGGAPAVANGPTASWPAIPFTTTQLELSDLPKGDGITTARYAMTKDGIDATYVMPVMPPFTMPMAMYAHSAVLNPDTSDDWVDGMLPWGYPISAPLAKPLGRYGLETLIQRVSSTSDGSVAVATVDTPTYTDFRPVVGARNAELTAQSVAIQSTPSRVLLALDSDFQRGLHVRSTGWQAAAELNSLGDVPGRNDLALIAWDGRFAVLWVEEDGSVNIAVPN